MSGNGTWGGARPNTGPLPKDPKRRAEVLKARAVAKAQVADARAAALGAARDAPPEQRRESRQLNFQAIQQIIEDSRSRGLTRERSLDWCPFVLRPELMGPPPDKKFSMAMDQSLIGNNDWAVAAWLGGGMLSNIESEGLLWLGYPLLSELAQRPEYRVISETIATEMTRKWIRFKGTQDGKVADDDDEQPSSNPPSDLTQPFSHIDNEEDEPEEGEGEKNAGQEKDKDRSEPDEGEDAEPDLAAARARAANPATREELNQGGREAGPGESEPAAEGEEAAEPTRPRKSEKADDKTAKIKELTDFLEDLKVRDRFATIALHDGLYGRAHLFLDVGADLDEMRGELATPIGNGRDEITKGKLRKGCLKALRVIEPVWTYPTTYNAQNPLRHDWYNPQVWYVMGKQIHCSRLLTFIGRPVPDLLKPAYSFGGLALSQMAKPYIDIWIKTRSSVADLIRSFSVMVLMTDLSTILQPGTGSGISARVALFNQLRDNQGTFVVNHDTEDFKNVSASLGGLHELQAQAQEHMASVARIPLVKFTGIQPSGLNASSEGEIRVWYDTVSAFQNAFFRPQLNTVIDIAQVSLWGEVDPDITWDFVPLWSMTEKEQAELGKLEAETGQILVDTGIISQEEERTRIAADPDSPYPGLDPEDVPELLQEEQMGLEIPHAKPTEGEGPGGGGPQGEEPGGAGRKVVPFAAKGDELDPLFARDAFEWLESDHPRDTEGKFSSGGGGGVPGRFTAPQFGLKHPPSSWTGGGGLPVAPPKPKPPLDPGALKRVGPQKGSNPGGTFENAAGERFYVKKGHSKDHVREELTAAALAKLAGARTLSYRPVEGGAHVATAIEKLDKDNANKLDPDEVAELRKDFATHAWLANWDVAGLGGDNIGTVKGRHIGAVKARPTALDLGGALGYRAQGMGKGAAFGTHVGEIATLRDAKMNRDAAKLFAGMSPAELRESARYVTEIPDKEIRDAVEKAGGPAGLAAKMIARRDDIARQARTFGAARDVAIYNAGEKPMTLPGAKFEPFEPPDDWSEVEGQAEIDEPELPALPAGKQRSSGIVIREPDGRVWMVRPKNAFGGYEHTFPKGRVDEGLSPQANAIKEAFEESGLKANVTGYLGDHEGDTTVTRYYLGERAGGDPSAYGEESDGVVLAPKGKLGGFLNRDRDKKLAAGLDAALGSDAEFKESEHPRDPEGKFATSGTTGGAPEGGVVHVGSEKTESEIVFKQHVENLITKPAIAGANYRRALVNAIKKLPSGYGDKEKLLKAKLIESWQKTYANFVKKGDAKKANAVAKTLTKLGVATAPITEAEVAPQLSEAAEWAAKHSKEQQQKAEFAAKQAKAETPPPWEFPPPSETEIAKAKKTVALQLQYVPGAGELSQEAQKEAQKIVDAFNKLYADKQMETMPQLVGKVNAFKTLTHKVQALTKIDAAKKAELAAAQAEAAKKAAAEAAAKAKAEQAAKKAELATSMKELGITEQEADGFMGLLKMVGGSQADLIKSFKNYASKAAAFGYPISGFQAALIHNYTDGGYGQINSALRSGSWTEAQHVYVKLLNKAIRSMPTFTGTTKRGTSLPSNVQAQLVPGKIWEERGFMSTSPTKPWSGNTQFTIKAIGKHGAYVKKLSAVGEGENEVLYAARTFFRVTKTETKGSQLHVYMEEMEE